MTETPKRRGRPKMESTKEPVRYKVTNIGPEIGKKVLTLDDWLDFFGQHDCSRLKASMMEFVEVEELRAKYSDYKPRVPGSPDDIQFGFMIEAIAILAKQKGCLID